MTDPDKSDATLFLMASGGASMHEVMLEALSRVLLEADMALQLFADPRAQDFAWVKEHLQSVFDDVNAVMLELTD